uniref:Uncharacterized protein n=1 Tax=Panagrolaimus superbus TaxID=310955 RepID=A0A914Z4G6_9BILA
MPWQIASFIGLFLTLIINTTCPYFRKSRRGILLSHWMVINWTLSNHWNSFIYASSQNPFILLLPISTLLLAVDQSFHHSNEDDLMNESNCYSFITVLMMLDAFILTLIRIFTFEMALITLGSMVFVFIGLLLKQSESRKKSIEKSFEYLQQNSAYCFFNDIHQPLSCFGRHGYILYFSLFCIVLRQIIPSLKLYLSFNYFLYIALTIGTINFIRTPVYIGGFVQSVKNIGAGAIELLNKRKQINQLLET